jgi:hypothetical protein
MSAIRDLPEIAGLDGRQQVMRIPAEIDVPNARRNRDVDYAARSGDYRHG